MPNWLANHWKSTRNWFNQLSGTSRIGIFAVAFAILITAVEFLMHLKDARELMTSALVLGLDLDPTTTKVEMRGWLFLAISLGLFLLCTFFLLWMRAELRGNSDHTVRTLRGVMRAAGHICRRLFPQNHVSDLTMEKVHFVYQIDKNFNAQVRRTFRIRAGTSPVYFLERGFRVRDHADPTESLIDIEFQVRDLNDPDGVVYLPMVNEPKNKSACIFFLPRIEPGEARTIELSYRWNGMARSLKVEGEEEFTMRQTTADNMAEFALELYLEPGTGGTLSWEESGHPITNKVLAASQSQLDWPGVLYTGKDVPPLVISKGIRLRLRWKAN